MVVKGGGYLRAMMVVVKVGGGDGSDGGGDGGDTANAPWAIPIR